jgi:polyphosphate glucokinase
MKKILVIDVGGTNIKVMMSGQRKPLKIPSGPRLTPQRMVREVREATKDWKYDVVSIGYPGAVARGKIVLEPVNIGKGWVRFNFRKAFRRPVRVINDAAMQALGSYRGGNMLFLGLGTGLGTAMVLDGALVPMEIQHLPYHDGYDYEEFVGEAGMKRLGKHSWRRHVAKVTKLFMAALGTDYVVYGGGNSKHLTALPRYARLGKNANAFKGGFRLWDDGRAGSHA